MPGLISFLADLLLQAKRAARHANELDSALSAAHADMSRLEDELASRDAAVAELRASQEVLASASAALQVQMEVGHAELAKRATASQQAAEASTKELEACRCAELGYDEMGSSARSPCIQSPVTG